MAPENFIQMLQFVANDRTASALCLSKGGWEGWLQCELWSRLSDDQITVEREIPYPGARILCDLVVTGMPNLWVELKAFGIFRDSNITSFLDAFAVDVGKLDNAPPGTAKLATLVIPHSIGRDCKAEIEHRFTGIKCKTYGVVDVFFVYWH